MNLGLDLKFALRTFAKRPGFTLVAALTLALGIGSATAVFSIVDAVLLRPLSYRDPDRLVAIWTTSTREASLAKIFAEHRNFLEYERHATMLESVSEATWAFRPSRILSGYGSPRSVLTIPASATFFDTLGVSAAIGRTFRVEDRAEACTIVIAHSFWTETFGSDPQILGKKIPLDDKPCEVIGVMPESFLFYPKQTQVWVLLRDDFNPDWGVGIFARLKPGVTREQAQAELRSVYRAADVDGKARDFMPVVYDLHGEFTFLAGRTLRVTLIVVFAAVLLVLLIACLNVANLLLARLSDRQRELAVRAALGSGRARLLRQVLTEGLMLSVLGALPGILFAWAALRYFRVLNPIDLGVGAEVKMNLPVLLFSVGLTMVTTILSGLLPALQGSKIDLAQRLKTGGRGAVRGSRTTARTLIAVEMAVSFVLLIGAGLLMTSALRMGSENLGFDPNHLVSAGVSLPAAKYATDADRARFYDQLLDRMPGAEVASRVPPDAGWSQVIEIQGVPVEQGKEVHDVGAEAVSPGFFDATQTPLLRGRGFNSADRLNSLPVAVVNEALASEYFPHSDAIGKQIRIPEVKMPWLTIVGVVGNLKHTELMNEMTWYETPAFYRPISQEPRAGVQVVLRTRDDLAAVNREMVRQVESIDPSVPVGKADLATTRLAETLAYPRFRAIVLAFFAMGALMLSAVGLHGVLSQLVAQRTAEFGVRRAIGAQTRDLLLLVARQGGAPVIAGLAVGMGFTLVFSRLLASLLYGIQPADVRVMGSVSLGLLTVAALAILIPARRAARVDPAEALRAE